MKKYKYLTYETTIYDNYKDVKLVMFTYKKYEVFGFTGSHYKLFDEDSNKYIRGHVYHCFDTEEQAKEDAHYSNSCIIDKYKDNIKRMRDFNKRLINGSKGNCNNV